MEFNQYFAAFASKNYDVLDPDDTTFTTDFADFQDRILELDMKLAAILCQAFDDCYNLESVFKLINIVGSVLDRPKIKEEFTNKYADILQMLDAEIGACEQIYGRQIEYRNEHGHLFADRSYPPVTSTLRWIRQLGARITAPIRNFQVLHHPITKTTAALLLCQRYDELMRLLNLFEQDVFDAWVLLVPQQIEENLQKTLIDRSGETRMLALNFHPQLFAILREVYHMKLLEKEGVPEVGIEFAEKNEMYRGFTVNLEKTIDWYNRVSSVVAACFWTEKLMEFLQIMQKSTRVELELIKREIEEIDEAMEMGIHKLTWNSESICACYRNYIR